MPAWPKVYAAGWANAVVLNHELSARFSDGRFGFDRTSGGWAPAEKQLQLFVWVVTVFGAPVWNVATLLCDHPSAI